MPQDNDMFSNNPEIDLCVSSTADDQDDGKPYEPLLPVEQGLKSREIEPERPIYGSHNSSSDQPLSTHIDQHLSEIMHTSPVPSELPTIQSCTDRSPNSNVSMPALTLEHPASINARVTVKHEGVTFNIGENATVHLEYGARINQARENHVLDDVVQRITRSRNAEYDMVLNATRGPCTPGTRISILKKVVDWCNAKEKTLYWMSGVAGTGKTTLMYSICHMLNNANLLGASFFCSRYLSDCKSIPMILPTISFELARRYPAFAESLASVLRHDPDIVQRELGVQLRRLVIEPWNAKKEELPEHIVVVIDALDECDQYHGPFLQLLFDHVAELPFKILIASRPEVTVRENMLGKDSSILSTFILHDVEADLVRADIVKYLESNLSSRTTPDIISTIADLAGSLFIYAATVVKLLITSRVNIRRCIEALQSTVSSDGKMKPTIMAPLDALYLQVLNAVLDEVPFEDEVQSIKNMLYTVVCAYEPLTRRGLADLWSVDAEDISRWVDLLRSVLSVSDDPEHPITAFHASFADFILDPSRSQQMACDFPSFNLDMAKHCMALMHSQLRPNLCKLDNFAPNGSIPADVIHTQIRPGLRYAAIYLTDHWVSCSLSVRQEVLVLVKRLLTVHLLCWFECLSLIGKLGVSIQSLDKILNKLDQDATIVALAYDALRMIQHYYDVVVETAMLVHPAFAWIPSHSPLRSSEVTFYASNSPRVLCGLSGDWTGPERVIGIDSGELSAISISYDGNRIVCGSLDHGVHNWDMRNQIKDCVLEGHTDEVSSIALFKAGRRIISGSYDGTVRIWDMSTHKAVIILDVSSPVITVAISPDEGRIASGHWDGIIRIWDARNGILLHSLEGHSDWVWSITFVPDSKLLVSASDDGTTRIWNLQAGVTEHLLHGHKSWVQCVACSSDGTKIITGSLDETARVWDTLGTTLQTLRGHSDSVRCAAFLRDRKRAVTGSDDGTLRIWDINNGHTLHTFTGAGEVRSIGVFPDGQRIASCSGNEINIWSLRHMGAVEEVDKTNDELVPPAEMNALFMAFALEGHRLLLLRPLCILDTATLEVKAKLTPADREYDCGALSLSGSKVAAATSRHRTKFYEISVWVLKSDCTTTTYRTFQGHTKKIKSVSFSHDERQLVSASFDRTAIVWNAATGTQIHVLDHPVRVYRASFSHSNTRILSSSQYTAHIWDAQSGQQLHRFDINTFSVAFTPYDQHIVASIGNTTVILNAESHEYEHEYVGCHYWTTLKDGTSYALDYDGWVYRTAHFNDHPRKIIWIPFPYRSLHDDGNMVVETSGPLFTSSPQGIQLCLPRQDGLVTLLIPHDYAGVLL